MRAIALDDFGAKPGLRDLPTPEPGPGEILVRVRASSVNGFDAFVAAGMTKGMMEHRFPVVLGKDFAGTVEALGPGATRFAVGDRVFGVVTKQVLGGGAWAKYVSVSEGFTAAVPAGLDLGTAGVLGLAGATALQTVGAVAPVAGETVLISGATGGVGVLAIQLAAARGATVLATAQPGEQETFVRGLGAAETVDNSGDLAAAVRARRPEGVQAAIHLAGDGAALADLLAPQGRIASALFFGPDAVGDRQITATSITAMPDTATLDLLAAEVVAGRLRVPVQHSYRLEDVPQAMADFAAGKQGKLAISLS